MFSYEVSTVEVFDANFFAEFIALRQRLNAHSDYFVAEELHDYRLMFADKAPFHKEHDWRAYLVKENDVVVGRAIVSCHKIEKKFATLGFFESVTAESCLPVIIEDLNAWLFARKISLLKGPIQGDIFHSSRLKVSGPDSYCVGEALHPKHYGAAFLQAGFKVSATWQTRVFKPFCFLVMVAILLSNMWRNRKIMKQQKINVRNIRLEQWDDELKLLYELCMDAYGDFDDFLPLTFAEFQVFHRHTPQLINPRYSFFIEYEGKAIAFYLAAFDKLHMLARSRRFEKLSLLPKFLLKPLTLISFLFSPPPFTIPYVGKAKAYERKVKCVSEKATVVMILKNPWILCAPVYASYLSEKSPMWKKGILKLTRPLSRFAIYEYRI